MKAMKATMFPLCTVIDGILCTNTSSSCTNSAQYVAKGKLCVSKCLLHFDAESTHFWNRKLSFLCDCLTWPHHPEVIFSKQAQALCLAVNNVLPQGVFPSPDKHLLLFLIFLYYKLFLPWGYTFFKARSKYKYKYLLFGSLFFGGLKLQAKIVL